MQELQPQGGCVGSYEILHQVAQGVYTDLYEARHSDPRFQDRRVLLRVLREASYAHHFLEMARINSWLTHPRIPAIYEVNHASGQTYSVRYFVDGDNLQNGIGGNRRSIEEVLRIAGDVADALDYAHGREVIHGYVHPRHVLLGSDGSSWLIGFGEYPHPPGEIVGNPLHFAPEQFRNDKVTPATDVYCLSETCFWLLCGLHPFQHLGITELQKAKTSGHLPRGLRDIRPEISTAIERVLLRGMSPDPASRFATPGEFSSALVDAHRTRQRSWWCFWD